MNAEWAPTDEYYRRIMAASDDVTRRALYLELFVRPWQSLLAAAQMMRPGEASQDDELALARGFNWLLPDKLREVPPALRTLEDAGAWATGAAALTEGIARLEPLADRLGFDTVTGWLVLADPAHADPVMRGYTGGIDWGSPRFICQFDTPNDRNLPHLPGLVVHELHHLIRLSLFPWHVGTTVTDYIVLEGLAESFAAEAFGEDIVSYYVTEFDMTAFDQARRILGEGLQASGFDVVRAYIFGDYWSERLGLPLTGMPTYGGYALGYHTVQAFLKRTGLSVVEATLLPADEIVSKSGFFA